MKHKVFLKTLVSFVFTLAALAAFALVRARFLPEVEVPILLYDRVGDNSDDRHTVPADLFYLQIRDLAENGYKTVSPARLRAYSVWGLPLPEKPIVITFDNAYRDLLTTVAPILEEQQFTAIINLATTYIGASPEESRTLNGEPVMTWTEIREAMKKHIFIFGGHTRNPVDLRRHEKPFNEIRASRTDIKRATGAKSRLFSYPLGGFSPEVERAAKKAQINFAMTYGNAVAKIGPRTDFLALPRIRVVGGRHAFTANVVERLSPGVFGVVKVTHPQGPVFPFSILVYGSDSFAPLAQIDVDDLKPDGSVELPLPATVKFPVTIELVDSSRTLLYFTGLIPKNAVVRETQAGLPPVNINYDVHIDPMP